MTAERSVPSVTSDPEVIRIGIQILNYMAPAYALFVFIEIYSGALRGIGDVIIPTIMTCCGVCVFRTLWVFLLVPKITYDRNNHIELSNLLGNYSRTVYHLLL